MGWFKRKKEEEIAGITLDYLLQFEGLSLDYDLTAQTHLDAKYCSITQTMMDSMIQYLADKYVGEIKAIDCNIYIMPDYISEMLTNKEFSDRYLGTGIGMYDKFFGMKVCNKILEMLKGEMMYSETSYKEHLEELEIKKQVEEKLGMSLEELKRVL